MLKSLRRSFGMSPSSSDLQDYISHTNSDGVLSPSNKPNTFVPLRRSNSFTNFFSSSRPSSPVKESFDQSSLNAVASPAKASSSAASVQVDTDVILAYLVLLDKKGRQKERFPIQNARTTMGRSLDNDVRFLVNDVSRHHCTIEIEIKQDRLSDGTDAFLQVLGANGVLLNDTQVLPAPRGVGRYQLQSGDSIKIAKRCFIFELPSHDSQSSTSTIFSSPVKGSVQPAVPQTPSNRRRVRMSLVNAAQINTPARPSKKSDSPSKTATSERDTRRANGLQRFMQSANVSPGKSRKNKSRQSLTSSTSATDMFGTPAKTRTSLVIPNTAPPKQVSFSLYANSFTGRLSPVKQMRMMPPLDTMNEEQDGSFHSENNESFRKDDAMEEQADSSDSQQDESSEDLVIVEELEQEQEPLEAEIVQSEPQPAEEVESAANEVVNTKNVQPATPSSSSASDASPSKSGSPKRAKRRSSFFGRAGPFAGINLGFYAEERTESKEPAKEVEQVEEPNEEFSDASDVEQAQMEDETPAPQAASSPVARRVVSRAIGMSKTPSPVKHQHFAGLTPLARRPRLSLASRRKVSLRTQTLLRSSEAYADRLFLPPPPSTPNGPSSLSKSMSMPSDLSDFSSDELEPASEQLDANDFDAERDPAMGKEAEEEAWKDSEDDEDEVDQSLSAISPSPLPAHLFSPVKASTLPKFATPQPASRTHSRRISMPPAGAADVKPSIRSTLIRLQISGAGERIVHQAPRMEEAASAEVARADRTSPSKARKVVRVSDVGLPATELSMGFDLVQDGAAEHDSNNIAGALNDLFTAEQEELTDDEDEEEYEEQEEIVQISSKIQESPARKTTSVAAPSQAPQTPAALNSVRHLFSAAAVAAPATPDMHGLGSMLDASPSKTPRYGSLGDRMRSSPEGSELLSPSKSSPRKKAILGSSPEKARRGVRRSQAAEVAVPAVRADAPAAVPDQTSETATEQPAFEAELHVTMLDASAMDAQNEAIAQAFAATEEHAVDAEEVLEDFAATSIIEDVILEEPAGEEELADEETAQVDASPVDDPIEEAVAEPAVPAARAPVAVEERAEEVSPVEQPATVEPSPSKTRASRRAASASPVKRTARSASPTKRALRSSPVKRGAASEVFAEETVQEAVQEPEAPVLEAQPEEAAAEPEAAAELEVSSPAKPARKTGGRKAKQAATEALVTSTPAPSSPEKPAPTKRGRAAKKAEAEQTHDEEERSEHEEAIEVAEEAPKRATRARATRAKPAAKPARTTRARAVKATEPALPSSSAGYGDDEASEEDVPAAPVKTKRATASRAKTTKTAKAAAAVEASEAEEHSADEPEAVKAKAPARTTRTKASTTKSKSKASAAESEDTTSSATTGTTTRSGRTTRRTAK